eukprot:761106-Lingulodinium_polyedra.AAC.1
MVEAGPGGSPGVHLHCLRQLPSVSGPTLCHCCRDRPVGEVAPRGVRRGLPGEFVGRAGFRSQGARPRA